MMSVVIATSGRYFRRRAAALTIFFCIVFAVHFLQSLVTAALEGQMEMVTNLRQFRHSRRKFLCHHVGLNGTETDAFNAFHFMYLTDDVCQGDGFQILAVTCHMDAGEHHFFEAVFRQTFYFCDNVLRLTAADGPAGIRNDTVGTELAATVLNLQIGSGAVCQFLDFQRFKTRSCIMSVT